jgi:hypothetical protein
VTASEILRLAAGSRPARGGSLRFSAIETSPCKAGTEDLEASEWNEGGGDGGSGGSEGGGVVK